jgi:hypothetical protein
MANMPSAVATVPDPASAAEINAGTVSDKYIAPSTLQASKRNIRYLVFHLIDSTTDVAVDTDIGGDFTLPFSGKLQQDDTNKNLLMATTTTAGVTGTMVVDVHLDGTTIMDTNKLDIDSNKKTTVGSATQPDLSTVTVTKNQVLTFHIDAIHTTAAKGLKVHLAILED